MVREYLKRYILPGILLLLFGLTIPAAAAQPLVVEATLLNVRTGPGTIHSIITQIPVETVVTAEREEGSWTQIILPDGRKGWVASRYTEPFLPRDYAAVDVSLLNVRSGPGTGYNILTRFPRETAVPVLQEKDSWLQILLPGGGKGWLAGWYTNHYQNVDYVSVTANLLNMRSGPGTNHQIKKQLPRGQILAVLERKNGWEKVALFEGLMGWVSGTYTASLDRNSVDSPAPVKPPAVSPLQGKTIVIDPGHGGADPGAVGITGYFEKTVNLAVALELAPMIREAGARVLMTRWSDWNPGLWQRVHLANTNQADLFVSIHANAHPLSHIRGTETYYNPWGANAAASRSLAANLQQQLVSSLGIRDIGVKTAGFYVISNTNMPSALVELAFLSNYNDEALLRRPETHRSAAEALFRGLENYCR